MESKEGDQEAGKGVWEGERDREGETGRREEQGKIREERGRVCGCVGSVLESK